NTLYPIKFIILPTLRRDEPFIILAIAAICLSLSFSPLQAEEDTKSYLFDTLDVGVSGSLDYYSRYVWRGFTLDKDAVMQPGLSFSSKGFTLALWSSFDTDNKDSLSSDEIDVTIDYTKEMGDISLSVGNTYYSFPEAGTYSKEYYVGLGFSALPLSPSLTFYGDYGDESTGGGDGYYVSLGLSNSTAIGDTYGITLETGLTVGYNSELFILGEGYDLLASLGFNIPLKEKLSIAPVISYAAPFGDLEDEADGNQEEITFGGVSLAYEF
ncbi:MAG: hypothetical protein ABIJ24_06075, partial [Nitrospinota bacterium]